MADLRFHSNSLATAQALPSVTCSLRLLCSSCAALSFDRSCRSIAFAAPDNDFLFTVSASEFSVNFQSSWTFERRCSEH